MKASKFLAHSACASRAPPVANRIQATHYTHYTHFTHYTPYTPPYTPYTPYPPLHPPPHPLHPLHPPLHPPRAHLLTVGVKHDLMLTVLNV